MALPAARIGQAGFHASPILAVDVRRVAGRVAARRDKLANAFLGFVRRSAVRLWPRSFLNAT